MLSFQNVVIYMALAMVIPTIFGILSSVLKKASTVFLILGGIFAVLPVAALVYLVVNTISNSNISSPAISDPANWTALIILGLEFITVSLAIIDAIVLGGTITKEPVKSIFYLILSLIVCSGFFYGMNYIRSSMDNADIPCTFEKIPVLGTIEKQINNAK